MKKIYLFILILLVLSVAFYHYGRGLWYPLVVKAMGKRTVAEVIALYGPDARETLKPMFAVKEVSYPPDTLSFVAFKDTDMLEVWAANNGQAARLILNYPVKAASGVPGPKLREGDKQVPEGMYKIVGFNPNSAYHLSMKLNYPNEFDLHYARQEGRTEPGTNIFIHGKAISIGCLAMGDSAIEALFTLVHDTGKENTSVLISPTNPAINRLQVPEGAPEWTEILYRDINAHYQSINPVHD